MNNATHPFVTGRAGKVGVGRVARQWGVAALLALWGAFGLSGCGGGAGTEANPNLNGAPAAASYTGPTAANDDIRAFQTSLWANINGQNRCGACHHAGGQTPQFARTDDINQAYAAALQVVDLKSPIDSRMVQKVGGGHNCWEAEPSVCADLLTKWISNWAGGTAGSSKTIQLEPPKNETDPGASKTFPADVNATNYATTVHPLLVQHCSGCHVDTSKTAQRPYFANSDPAISYAEVTSYRKIDLDTPSNSRLVVRLRDEFHNCWSDCAQNAQEMLDAINAFAGNIPITPIDPTLVTSKAITIADSTVAAGGNRYEANQIALWQFKTGKGTVAYDTSGIDPAMNLSFIGPVTWVGGWGIMLPGGTAKVQASTTTSKKLSDLIKSTGEYSIEAWVVPDNVAQDGPARIVSYSASSTQRNFTLGQTKYNYDFLNRVDNVTDENGMPALSTPDAAEVLQATLQHVVATFDPVNGRRIYVNGQLVSQTDPQAGGNLTSWQDTFAFVLGNETDGLKPWKGVVKMVAIHNRAMTEAEINQNFAAGVGEKYYMLFDISQLTNMPQSYIMFEVSQYDSYSYLFNKPTFVSLDPNANPANIHVKGLRIGLNSREVPVGQAYANMDTYITQNNQVLSTLGTVIAMDKGPDNDQFFLTFEDMNGHTHTFVEPPVQAQTPLAPAAASDIGVRTFDAINATMAQITGVDPSVVKPTFDGIRQALPAVKDPTAFLAAQQMVISQLAISYCSALVNDATLRSNFFGNFNFTTDVYDAFGIATGNGLTAKKQIFAALYDKMAGLPQSGTDLTTAPARSDVEQELIGYDGNNALVNAGNLYDTLAGTCTSAAATGCDATRTQAVVKAMCAATLGSAAMLVQ